MGFAVDQTSRTLTAAGTEAITGTSVVFTAVSGMVYIVHFVAVWQPASVNFLDNLAICLVDGSTTGVDRATGKLIGTRSANAATTERFSSSLIFLLSSLSAGSHTVSFSSDPNGTGLDRTFTETNVLVLELSDGR